MNWATIICTCGSSFAVNPRELECFQSFRCPGCMGEKCNKSFDTNFIRANAVKDAVRVEDALHRPARKIFAMPSYMTE